VVKVIVTGSTGRMGSKIIQLVSKTEGMELAGAVECRGHALIGTDIGECQGLGKTGIIIDSDLAKCIEKGDVVIDFTCHEASVNHLRIAAEHGRAMVIGSTGFDNDEMQIIGDLSQKTRCMVAPNMSVGVNVMLKVLESVAAILGDDYDVELIEAHHNMKKDAPSGTAIKMAQVIADSLERNLDEVGVYCRKGIIGERTKKEIGIQTVRAGDIIGEHTVIFGGIGERLEITHKAHSRDNFAMGAIRAALWIVEQKKGLYDMQDVLGLR